MSKLTLDEILSKGTGVQEDGLLALPGVVAIATDLKRELNYSKACGVRTLDPNGAQSMELDGVCYIASMTKLMTAVAAMQTVERGLIALDDDVSNVLHEWKDAEILDGFDESGKPILRKSKNKITLRLLLCHSSGIAYDILDPKLIMWRKSLGQEGKSLSGSIDEGYKVPLVFEPGEGWAYGPGPDWAGRLVERLNGGISLGEYMGKHIWGPLGMTSTTFNMESRPDLKARKVDMTLRLPTDQLIHLPTPVYPSPAQDDCGGVGAYSTAPDYMKLLTSLLRNDGKLLNNDSIEEMFRPQLPDPKYLEQVLQIPELHRVLAGNFPKGLKADYGLGGMLNMEPLPTGRCGGAMQWGGMPNLAWWIDRKSGVCGTYFSQLMPQGDPASTCLLTDFETAVYKSK